jgi:hypothetical protein
MTNTKIRHPVLFAISGVLVLFLGLCTPFVLVATGVQAWQEHEQSQWPQAMATVEQCGLTQTSTKQRNHYYIRCRLRYELGFEQLAARIYSASVPAREVAQYPEPTSDGDIDRHSLRSVEPSANCARHKRYAAFPRTENNLQPEAFGRCRHGVPSGSDNQSAYTAPIRLAAAILFRADRQLTRPTLATTTGSKLPAKHCREGAKM